MPWNEKVVGKQKLKKGVGMLYTGVGVLKMEGPVATYAPWGRRAERF